MNQSSTELIEVVGRLLGELVRSDAFERGTSRWRSRS
jgi:hypothetical protein